jgi:ABC-2 type transport system permease protein
VRNVTTSKVDTDLGVPILVPGRTFGNDLRAIRIVWHRDLIRFCDDKARILASFGQPMLHLFVLGTGMSSMMAHDQRYSLRTFLFPGVLSLSVLFTCFLSAGSMVMDREFGFMRVMLVAPVRRGAIVLGKCLSGATIGALQGSLVVALGGFVGVPYDPLLIATLVAQLVLLSFAITSFGVMVAVFTKRMHTFLAIMRAPFSQ